MDASFSSGSSGAGQLREPVLEVANWSAQLTIVVPTLNERENVEPLVEKIAAALPETPWEIIFVDDDSPDGTADTVRALARRDSRVHCIQRIGRRGLSTACIEGVLASSSPYIAVMDGDLQHDERLLPQMLQALKNKTCDIAVGSRYVAGGGLGEWGWGRASISFLAIRLSRSICRVPLADPMSGFFMARREAFEGAIRRLSGKGFKILLDLMASSPQQLRVSELPFHFRPRQHGSSKLDTMVAWEFVLLLLDKLTGRRLASNSLKTVSLICSGFALYLCGQWLTRVSGAGPLASKSVALVVSATAIFFLNQLLTYRDERLGGTRLAFRLLLFLALTGLFASWSLRAIGDVLNGWNNSQLTPIASALVSTLLSYAVARVLSRPKRIEPPPVANGVSASAQYAQCAEPDELRKNISRNF
jgi:dolichol-phosphate mannosyltransferase